MKVLQNTWLWGIAGFLFTIQFCWGQEYKLEHKFAKGEMARYKRTIHSQSLAKDLPGGKMERIVEYYTTRKVENVYPDGAADVIQTQDSVITRVNQERVPNPKEEALNGIPILIKTSKTGTYQEIRALKEVPSEAMLVFETMQHNLQNKPGFPIKALKASEAWNNEIALLQNIPCCGQNYDHTITQKSTSTLLGAENYLNMPCTKVLVSGTTAGTAQTCCFTYISSGKVQGTQLFDCQMGKEIKTTTNIDLVMNRTNSAGKMQFDVKTVATEELLK
ncbi:hypothetical protein L0244_33580 [bacterium]|nr:hypothetical protein [bacterium]